MSGETKTESVVSLKNVSLLITDYSLLTAHPFILLISGVKEPRLYTPQAVVGGRYEFVGSRAGELATAVARAAQAPQAAVAVAVADRTAQVRVRSVPAGTPVTEVLLTITESGLASQVGRGENAGRRLQHASVVRQLIPLGKTGAGGTFAATHELLLPANWQPAHLRVVALVQETALRRIVGAGVTALVN